MIQRKKSKPTKQKKRRTLKQAIDRMEKVLDDRRRGHVNERMVKSRDRLIKTLRKTKKKSPLAESDVGPMLPTFDYDETFRSIAINGESFTLTALQAQVARYLFSHRPGTWLVEDQIMVGANLDHTSMRNIFKAKGKWQKIVEIVTKPDEQVRATALFVNLKGKGRWRLNIRV